MNVVSILKIFYCLQWLLRLRTLAERSASDERAKHRPEWRDPDTDSGRSLPFHSAPVMCLRFPALPRRGALSGRGPDRTFDRDGGD